MSVTGKAARSAFWAESASRRRRFHAAYEPATRAYATRPKARRSVARPSGAISASGLRGLRGRVLRGTLRHERARLRDEDAVAERPFEDDVTSDLEQVGDAAAIRDGNAGRRGPADVLEPEPEAAMRVGVALNRADDRADERDVSGVAGERTRAQLCDAVPGKRRVDDEHGESGRHREGNHEPRRTGSHARIVALVRPRERQSRAVGLALRRPGRLPRRDAVPVLVAERAGCVLGEGVAVPLAVGGPDEGGHDVEVPVRHLEGLPPQVGEAEVDVELEEVDPGGSLRHAEERR